MNERLQRYSDWFRGIGRPIVGFAKQNRAVFLSLTAGFSILLIVWARLGFTLNISTFFAAETPSPATLTVQCSGNQAILSWNIPANANSNSIQKKLVSDGLWQWAMQDTGLTRTTYTDSFSAPTIYRHKSGANVASNEVRCPPIGATPTATQLPPPTLSATCVDNSIPVTMTAGQSVPVFVVMLNTSASPWTSPADYLFLDGWSGANSAWRQTSVAMPASPIAQNQRVTFAFNLIAPATVGTYSINYKMIRGGVAEFGDLCGKSVVVSAATATPSMTPTLMPTATSVPTIAFNITGQNITLGGSEVSSPSAFTNQDLLLIARIRNVGSEIVSNAITRISIPSGLTYVAGSTRVNGTQASTDSIVGGGLTLGSLGLSQEIMVQMQVRANWSVLDQAILQVPVVLSVRADGINEQVVSTTVLVSRTSIPPAAVSTGPGDATLIALMVSAITALLYLSYTRSPTYRRHEIESSGGSGEPLDFRN